MTINEPRRLQGGDCLRKVTAVEHAASGRQPDLLGQLLERSRSVAIAIDAQEGIQQPGIDCGWRSGLEAQVDAQQQRAAHLVNISSVFGLIGFPGQSAYNASKFAVRGFTEALRHELADSHVKVSCVHPGGIRTNIARNARASAAATVDLAAEAARFENLTRTSPEQAAARIIRGVLRNEPRILIGPDAWFIDRVQRWLPVRYWRLFKPIVEWQSGK